MRTRKNQRSTILAGQAVQNIGGKLATKIFFEALDPPGDKERARLTKRLTKIEQMATSIDVAAQKTRQLTRLPDRVKIRPQFAIREKPAPGEVSDRRLPPPEDRPPATRIVTPRGIPLKFYLIALFEAQTRRPGETPDNTRRLHPRKSGEIGWTSLIASPAVPGDAGATAATVSDKKQRQVQEALRRLASNSVQLVHLPNRRKPVGTYDGFQLLNEQGFRPDEDANPRYVVPHLDEQVLHLPQGLFTNGWIHALEDSEITFLLMLACMRALVGGDEIRIAGWIRIRHFGLGRDAYQSQHLLERFGLVEIEVDPNRREDGKVRNYGRGNPSFLNRFNLLDDGFERPASTTVISALQGRLGLGTHTIPVGAL
jgi:hypothetical protein